MEVSDLVTEMTDGIRRVGKESPQLAAGFNRLDTACYTEGRLSRKQKELMAVAVSVAMQCSYCIGHHVKNCYRFGATRDEILEAASVGVVFGGSPAWAVVGAVLMPALDEFEG